ncbi:hypothetical protein V5799_020429 [Amblyomma americanum]|uniref:Uncharacterized protein n=1 Tax=Amblyomma americanum TaxID=6943 RepID=A0AAQ4EU31_AMBAM
MHLRRSVVMQWNAWGLRGHLSDFGQRVHKYRFPVRVICFAILIFPEAKKRSQGKTCENVMVCGVVTATSMCDVQLAPAIENFKVVFADVPRPSLTVLYDLRPRRSEGTGPPKHTPKKLLFPFYPKLRKCTSTRIQVSRHGGSLVMMLGCRPQRLGFDPGLCGGISMETKC